MTVSNSLRLRPAALLFGAVGFLCSGAGIAQSRTQQQTGTRQQQQFRQNLRQQQISNQLRDNRIEQQSRQRISNNTTRPYQNDPATTRQIEQADQSHRQSYQAHQQKIIDDYNDSVSPNRRVQPPSAQSGGH